MQNASPTSHESGNNNNVQQTWPTLPSMYSTHHRSASDLRSYAVPESNLPATEAQRDDVTGQIYPGGESYSYQQSAGYHPMSNVGYGYAGGGMGMSGYNPTTSPAPSGSRQVSGQKPDSTPPASTPSNGPNPSPGSRYYAQTSEASSGHRIHSSQSPYQPSSAPPQAVSHNHASAPGQPQTAHPHGGGYYNYYDTTQQQPPSQWPQHYPQTSTQSFGQIPGPSRTSQTGSTSSSALLNQRSTQIDSHRPPSTPSSTAYDYSSTASAYPAWSQDTARHYQTSGSTGRGDEQGLRTMSQQTPWPGYPTQYNMAHQPHVAHGQSQYGWQPYTTPYGYAPPSSHQLHSMATPSAAGVHGKKSKKEKRGPLIMEMQEYDGLGKRSAEYLSMEEEADKLRKKGKKEEEKPIAKPPAKSQLHPPRQAQSAWQLFFTDELNKAKAAVAQELSPGGTPQHAKLNVAQIAKDAGAAYANLNDDQRDYYSHKVQDSKEQYAKDLAMWQATLTPEDIRAENAFRAQQRKEGKSRKGNLKDPNAPKKPLSAYFLFLKGIRENDDLRQRVWGEETETTKQSVLAAERWRGLTVEEKKPYLQQAERDKQEYESARKVYEDDAAARARGEDVPPRPIIVPDVPIVKLELPKARKKESVKEEPVEIELIPKTEIADFGDFRHETPENIADHSLAMEEYGGFSDPIVDLDLSGFHGESADGAGEQERQWVELTKLMGSVSEGQNEESSMPTSLGGELAVPVVADETAIAETDDTSIAPPMAEAMMSLTDDSPAGSGLDGSEVREVALAAEGSLAVPLNLEGHLTEVEASGLPTDEVNELPPADVPPVIDNLPIGLVDQVEAKVPIVTETIGAGGPGLAFTASPQLPAGVATRADNFIEALNESSTAGRNLEGGPLPLSTEVGPINTNPSVSLETATHSGGNPFDAIRSIELTPPLTLSTIEETGEVTAAPATANGVEERPQEHGVFVHTETPAVDGV